MWNLLSTLQKNLVYAIPMAMALGLFVGALFDASPLKQFIIPVTFIMVYPMMVTLNVQSIFKGRDYRLQLTTQLINFVLIPLLAYFIGRLFFSGGMEKYGLWAVGLFLIGVLPTSGMTISWTGFARGNKEAAIKMVVFGLILGALAAPLYTKVVMGTTVDVNMLHMFKQIALFIFVPLAAGLATQYYARRRYGLKVWNQSIKPKFPPFSALGVILIAFVAMSLKAKNIIANPADLVAILIPLAIFYAISYVFLSIIGKFFFKREDAIAMVFGVVMRDLSIALAIAMTAFGKQGLTIALLIALAYVIQIQSAAWYVKLVDWIFGPATDHPLPATVAAAAARDHIPAAAPPLPSIDGTAVIPGIQRILYATDLSETARHAARYACGMGEQYHAAVSLVHVIPDVVASFSAEAGINLGNTIGNKEWRAYHEKGIALARDAIHQRIQETSRQVKKTMPRCPIPDDNVMVRIGNPAKEIVAAAEEGNFDLIILGTHGHGKLAESIIGSVASDVIRQSRRPVMVVRLPGERGFAVDGEVTHVGEEPASCCAGD
jgi:arsenite transporter